MSLIYTIVFIMSAFYSLGGLLDISETAKQLARGCNRVGVWFFGDVSHSEPEENFQLLLS